VRLCCTVLLLQACVNLPVNVTLANLMHKMMPGMGFHSSTSHLNLSRS